VFLCSLYLIKKSFTRLFTERTVTKLVCDKTVTKIVTKIYELGLCNEKLPSFQAYFAQGVLPLHSISQVVGRHTIETLSVVGNCNLLNPQAPPLLPPRRSDHGQVTGAHQLLVHGIITASSPPVMSWPCSGKEAIVASLFHVCL
jgi:hypothetical protein